MRIKTILLSLCAITTVVASYLYLSPDKEESYEIYIDSIYVDEKGIYMETETGVFKYPHQSVAFYESTGGRDYILRSTDAKVKDKIFLTQITREGMKSE